MGIRDVMLTQALERQRLGTHMAAAYVDDDGTATIHLLQRVDGGWLNITTREESPITCETMATTYDDVVLTRWD